MRERLAEAGLAGAGRTVEEHDAVPAHQVRVHLFLREQHRSIDVAEERLLEAGFKHEALPEAVKIGGREDPVLCGVHRVLAVLLNIFELAALKNEGYLMTFFLAETVLGIKRDPKS